MKLDIWFGRPESVMNVEMNDEQKQLYAEFLEAEDEDLADDIYREFVDSLLRRFKDHILETIDIEVTEHD